MSKDKVREALDAFESKMGKPLGNPDIYVVPVGVMCGALASLHAALSAATEGEREEDRHEVSVTRQGVTIKVLAGDFDFAVDLSKRIDSFLVMPATPPLAPKKTDMDRCVACGHEREHHVPACRIGSPDDCHCAMFQEPTPKGPKPSGEWYCMQGRHANPQNCGPGACLGWAWRTLTPKDTPPPPDAARVESDVDGYCDPPAGPAPTREEARSKELLAALRDEKMKHAQVADYWAKQFAARDAEIATLRAQVEEAERSIEFLAATAENRARDIDHEKSRADAAEAKAKVAVRERDEALDALRDACEDRTDAERRIAEAVEFVAERVRETERQTERPTTWDALTYWETRQREAEMILRQLSDLTPQAGTEKK